MECLDFERLLNEQLDARDLASVELDRALEAHAADCPECRLIASRYQTLRQVLRVAARPPAPPVDFARQFLETLELDGPPRVHPRVLTARRALGSLAMAASLLALAFLGWRSLPTTPELPVQTARSEVPVPTERPQVPSQESPLLTDAIASAGSATWEFAVETSGPAARLGREFLDAAALQEPAPVALALTLPDAPPTKVLESVGDGVNARVRPFSGTARQAFGFLLGPAADASNPAVTSSKGS